MVKRPMPFWNQFRWPVIFMLLVSALLSFGCGGPDPTTTPADAARPTSTPPPVEVVETAAPALPPTATPTPPPLPTESEPPPTATSPPSPAESAASNGLVVPDGWFALPIDAAEMDGVVFVQQDPALLATFDDPTLAVPADFAGGALIITDLPAGADAGSMEAGLEANLASLSDQEFEAMLFAADRAGLINMAVVDHTVLQQARADSLAGRPAMVMAGSIHFLDERPPVLQGEIWLSWTEESFITYYALAAEAVWSQVEEAFSSTRQSLP